jgi:hypothetical protein
VTPAKIPPPGNVLHGQPQQVGYDQYSMLIGGRRVFITAGEFDPWRTPSPSLWLDDLQKMKADGYNAVTVYFDWDYNSPSPGVYDFTGVRDMNEFLNMAQQAGLYVIARTRGFSLLSTSFLSNLPLDFSHFEGRTSSTNESDRGVSRLQFSRVVEDLDLSSELSSSSNGIVSLKDHDVSDARHVFLNETLDVETNVVTSSGGWDGLVVHFYSEDLSGARSGWGVGWDENDFSSRGNNSLFNTSSDDISYSLNLVDSGNRHAHSLILDTWRNLDLLLEDVENGVNVNLVSSERLNVNSLPPGHVGRLGDQVVSDPSRDRDDWDGVINEVLLPSDTD